MESGSVNPSVTSATGSSSRELPVGKGRNEVSFCRCRGADAAFCIGNPVRQKGGFFRALPELVDPELEVVEGMGGVCLDMLVTVGRSDRWT